MLDVITDFWKPSSRKSQQAMDEKKLSIDELKIGCMIGFGFVPQAAISGRRLPVVALNAYRFDDQVIESFVLSGDQDTQMTLVVAGEGNDRFLALSRRLSTSERMKLFESKELDAIVEDEDATELRSKDGGDAYKGWLVPHYTKHAHAHRGVFLKGGAGSGDEQEFNYYLLRSPNNEHAVEIERYVDGRLEVYATAYRRLADIGQITYSAEAESRPAERKVVPLETSGTSQPAAAENAEAKSSIKLVASNDAAPKPEPKAELRVEVKAEPKAEQKAQAMANAAAENQKTEPKPEPKAEARPQPLTPAVQAAPPTSEEKKPVLEKENLTMNEPALSSKVEPMKAANESYGRAFHNPNAQENDAVECELRVANKVIEEAIRTEMRLSDVVRRIVELPVAGQESVQLPINLTEEDFKLLSIRYGIAASDKNAIRRRIVEDINDFAGAKK